MLRTGEFRHAARRLLKQPIFTATVVLTLALGIGANTAIFSVMNAVLMRSLPVGKPQELFYLKHVGFPTGVSSSGNGSWSFGIAFYDALRAQTNIVKDVIAYVPLNLGKFPVRYGDVTDDAYVDMVSGNFFSGLGAPIAFGSGLSPDDEKRHAQLVVLSNGYWRRRFSKDRSVIGKTLFLRGVPFTIAGVGGPGFTGVSAAPDDAGFAELWIPLQNSSELTPWGEDSKLHSLYGSPNWWSLQLMVRLAPKITDQTATAALETIFLRAVADAGGQARTGEHPLRVTLVAARGLGPTRQTYKEPLTILMGLAALVLVIACVNVTMLVIARNSSHRHRFSIWLALGANRRTFFRQFLAESILLVISGTLLGLVLAFSTSRILANWSGLGFDVGFSLSVFVLCIAIATGVSVGLTLIPLSALGEISPMLALRGGGTSAGVDRKKRFSENVAIIFQMAFCIVLVVAAALLIRTLRQFQTTDLGINTDRLFVFGVAPRGDQASKKRFFRELLDELRNLPGVEDATYVENRLGSGSSNITSPKVDGAEIPGKMMWFNNVGPNYFRVMGTPLLEGRDFLESDTETSQPIAIVDESFVSKVLNGNEPLGHTIKNGDLQATIVGVAKRSKYTSVDESAVPMAWFPYTQGTVSTLHVELRTKGDPQGVLPSIRDVLRRIDPDVAMQEPMSQRRQFELSYASSSLFARLSGVFGGLALVLVSVGLYGTFAYRVSRRRPEIGVRMAVGATRRRILSMVLGESLSLAALGTAAGVPAAFICSKWMHAMLYNVADTDVFSFSFAILALLLVCLISAMIPARKAASIEPNEVLRAQ